MEAISPVNVICDSQATLFNDELLVGCHGSIPRNAIFAFAPDAGDNVPSDATESGVKVVAVPAVTNALTAGNTSNGRSTRNRTAPSNFRAAS